MINEISTLLKGKDPKTFGAILRSYPELKERLQKSTEYLPENATINQRLFHILNNIEEIPKCKNCNNLTVFNSFQKGYSTFCGCKCANSNPTKKEKTQQVWLHKYGSKEERANISRVRLKNIMLQKTGYASNFHNPEFQEKLNGGKFAWNSDSREKRKATCQTKYGTDYACQSDLMKEATKKTEATKYEKGHHTRDSEIQEKIRKCLYDAYKVNNIAQIPGAQEKKRKTCLTKYGVENPAQIHIKHLDLWNNNEYIKENFLNKDNTIRYKEMMEFFGCFHQSSIRMRLQALEIEYKPYRGYSSFEVEIKEFLQNAIPTINIIENDRGILKPHEIDLYLPEYKIGIEFHGLTWHSFGKSPNTIHLEYNNKYTHMIKADKADKAGIQLLQIFENEWNTPQLQNIWKSVILAKIGVTSKIYARKCEIRHVTNKESNMFLQNNHLQQSMVGASVNLGMYFDNELVSVMTFGKTRFKVNTEWELLRFCNKVSISVIGGFARLLKYFIKEYHPKSILSYANRRWSTGKIYASNNFTFESKVESGYYYFHQENYIDVKHRIHFQKHKLHKLLDAFDANLTESQNMYNNGYRKIYDAGQLKYILNIQGCK